MSEVPEAGYVLTLVGLWYRVAGRMRGSFSLNVTQRVPNWQPNVEAAVLLWP